MWLGPRGSEKWPRESVVVTASWLEMMTLRRPGSVFCWMPSALRSMKTMPRTVVCAPAALVAIAVAMNRCLKVMRNCAGTNGRGATKCGEPPATSGRRGLEKRSSPRSTANGVLYSTDCADAVQEPTPCPWRDSTRCGSDRIATDASRSLNPHARRHSIRSGACLPVSPHGPVPLDESSATHRLRPERG